MLKCQRNHCLKRSLSYKSVHVKCGNFDAFSRDEIVSVCKLKSVNYTAHLDNHDNAIGKEISFLKEK